MKINEQSIIGDLVASNYKYSSVFKAFGIDFCCQGNRTIEEAAEQKELDSFEIIQQLHAAGTISNQDVKDYQSWPLDVLCDYIEKKHHRYVEEGAAEIRPYLSKIVKVHGAQHLELLEVENLFNASVMELAAHMKKEELILFPYIRKMCAAKAGKSPNPQAPFGSIQNPINAMNQDHNHEGERFRTISSLTNNYSVPSDGCNTYRVTLALLKEFEDDLHLHIHLENNILFPKAIEMEKELF